MRLRTGFLSGGGGEQPTASLMGKLPHRASSSIGRYLGRVTKGLLATQRAVRFHP